MTDLSEKTESKETNGGLRKGIDFTKPIKVVAVTCACAGAGVIGAIGAVTAAAVVGEFVLPALLCMKVAGITGGAIGLALGLGRKESREE